MAPHKYLITQNKEVTPHGIMIRVQNIYDVLNLDINGTIRVVKCVGDSQSGGA